MQEKTYEVGAIVVAAGLPLRLPVEVRSLGTAKIPYACAPARTIHEPSSDGTSKYEATLLLSPTENVYITTFCDARSNIVVAY
jgi:hypothetical protein